MICPNKGCGATLRDGVSFCTSCGGAITVAKPAPPPTATPTPTPTPTWTAPQTPIPPAAPLPPTPTRPPSIPLPATPRQPPPRPTGHPQPHQPLPPAYGGFTGEAVLNDHARQALNFGLLSFLCGCCSPFALYHGIVGLQEINASNGTQSGSGRAKTGIIIGGFYVTVIVLYFFAAIASGGSS